MLFFEFMSRSFAISFSVLIRFLPILILYVMLVVGIILSTDNIYVYYLLGFIASTVGTTFLYVMGLRAGLSAIGETTSAHVDGLVSSTMKLMVVHFLIQALVILVLAAFIWIGLVFMFAPEAPTAINPETGKPLGWFVSTHLEAVPSVVTIFAVSVTIIASAVTSFFGVPMAATAANAAEYSPKNDLIFGLGSFFVPQFILALIMVVLPVFVFSVLGNIFTTNIADASVGAQIIAASFVGILMVYFYCIPLGGMAIAYGEARKLATQARKSVHRPQVNVEEQREDLRSLRQNRQNNRKTAPNYDPKSQ